MNYLSEKITVVAAALSFALASIALMSALPRKLVDFLFWGAIAAFAVALIAAAWANTLYGWDW